MAIAWVSQVEKEHLVISIPKGSEATNVLLQREMFSVNELGVGQESLAKEFGGKNCQKALSPEKAKVVATDYDLPMLTNCCLTAFCKTINVQEINEQVLITAKIIDTISGINMESMVFKKSDFFG